MGGLRVEGLDVKFKVSLDAKSYGKADITIYNLNRSHRQELESAKDVAVELLVGYQDESLDRIFKGVPRKISSRKDNNDWITTIKTGDGDKATGARINRGYRKGTPIDRLWKDLVGALGAVGIDSGNAVKAFEQKNYVDGINSLLNGGALQGQALANLRALATGADLDVTIQDGELLVTQIGQAADTTALVLSPDTGLIGSPEKGTKGDLKVTALIIPGLRPKRKIRLESALTKGMFVVTKATYTGDTSANDWYATLECKELA